MATGIPVADPHKILLSNRDGTAVGSGVEMRQRLVAQVTAPVRWDLCQRSLTDIGVTALIELPPAGTLAGLAKRALSGIEILTLNTPDDLPAARDLIARHGVLPSGEPTPQFRVVVSTAAGTFGFGTRFVYVQSSSTNLGAVQRSDRFLSVLGACHFDKAKSARASSVAIRHDADSIHLAVNFEKLTQLFFGRVEIQVSNKDVLHANASGVSYLSVGASAGKQVAPEPFLESRPE